MWDAVDIAWIAGIIEADGSITSNGMRRKDGTKPPVVKVGMVDKEVIDKLHAVSGIGRVSGPHSYCSKTRPNNKPTWLWTVAQKKDVARLLLAIAPLLSTKRKEEALDAANRIRTGVI